ncbi:MAG: hypothetical protein KatS3mg115_1726 [Candidatus Poribacteria bacterium]|nr:MAG: hypothetical protein KatS3mg115_1726 [Candidatus Poribacteria bacterium]
MKKRYRFRISGMDCPGCAEKVANAARSVPGVRAAQAHLMAGRLEVEVEDPPCPPEAICEAVRAIGYGIALEAPSKAHDHKHEHAHEPDHDHEGGVSKRELAEILIAGACWLVGAGLHAFGLEGWGSHLPLALAALVGGYRVYWNAVVALRQGRITFNLLMTVAVLGAVAIDEWSEAAAVVVLFAVAELLESLSVARARHAVRALVQEMPQQVRVRRGEEIVTLPVEEAQIGDVAVARPGERIGLDGTILRGETQVSEAAITGESRLVPKSVGDPVYAGTLNDAGTIEFRVERPAEETVLSRMIELIAQAEQAKSRSERFVDRFARTYTPLLLLVAAGLTAVPVLAFGAPFETWFYRSLVGAGRWMSLRAGALGPGGRDLRPDPRRPNGNPHQRGCLFGTVRPSSGVCL